MIVRQGDILLRRVGEAPQFARSRTDQSQRLTLGYGEATGHHHVLESAVWVVAEDVTDDDLNQFALGSKAMPVWVEVTEPTTLTHQEHEAIRIDPGVWQVVRQREYSPEAARPVLD